MVRKDRSSGGDQVVNKIIGRAWIIGKGEGKTASIFERLNNREISLVFAIKAVSQVRIPIHLFLSLPYPLVSSTVSPFLRVKEPSAVLQGALKPNERTSGDVISCPTLPLPPSPLPPASLSPPLCKPSAPSPPTKLCLVLPSPPRASLELRSNDDRAVCKRGHGALPRLGFALAAVKLSKLSSSSCVVKVAGTE